MEKIRLGKTDMMVTKLGYGSIPIQRLAEDEAIDVNWELPSLIPQMPIPPVKSALARRY